LRAPDQRQTLADRQEDGLDAIFEEDVLVEASDMAGDLTVRVDPEQGVVGGDDPVGRELGRIAS
jgi:hypothetical protein